MELLFESRRTISGMTGKLRFVQNRPHIHPTPVMRGDNIADGTGASIYGSVLHDGGKFRMWYQAWPRSWDGGNAGWIGYAESNDGIEWTKPNLGVFDLDGSKENNLVSMLGHAPSVWIDPKAPAARRYRACFSGHFSGRDDRPAGYRTAHSADGINWTNDEFDETWPGSDVITGIYHPGRGSAMVAMKIIPRIGGMKRRCVAVSEEQDGRWSERYNALLPDDFDDVAALARGLRCGDYYGMGMMPAAQSTVGLLWQFRHAPPLEPDAKANKFGVVDISLTFQEGRGDCWQHVPGRPDFISHQDVPWPTKCIYTASNVVEVGDEQRLYFTASPFAHAWYVGERDATKTDMRRGQMFDEGAFLVGMASWQRDRLFSYVAEPSGIIELNLGVQDKPCELLLNYRCHKTGHMQVELKKRDGFGGDDKVTLTGDELGKAIEWKSGTVIPPSPEPLRVVLYLDRAEIFAYDVRQK